MAESTPSSPSPALSTTPNSAAASPPKPSTPLPSSPSNSNSLNKNNTKRVYLIRHAESLENQRIASMFSCLGDLGRFSLPKKTDFGASLELFSISKNADAPISELGHQQCHAMKAILMAEDFLQSQGIELVAHSPLERARQTCQELLGCSSDTVINMNDVVVPAAAKTAAAPVEEDNEETIILEPMTENEKESANATPTHSPDNSTDIESKTDDTTNTTTETKNIEKVKETGLSPPPPPPQKQKQQQQQQQQQQQPRVVNLELLAEKTHLEWVPGNSGSFEQRVTNFQHWLSRQSETVVCLVGHSQFFKAMLGLPFKFENCDVYQVEFDAQKRSLNEPIIMEHDGTADLVTLKPQWYDLKLLYSCKQPHQQPPPPQEQPPTSTEASVPEVGGDDDDDDDL